MTPSGQFGIACKTCRRRGRRCDRTLPTCKSCEQRGVTCEGYTLRWVGMAARGRLAGQASDSIDGSPSQVEQPSVHSDRKKGDLDTLQPNTGQRVCRTRYYESSMQAFPSLKHMAFEVPPSVSDSESAVVGTLVKIYARDISTAFYLGHGTAETPYTLFILPMTHNTPCIRYVAAATAASHIANRFYDNSLRLHSLHLRLQATEALRQQLEDNADETELSSLACMVLLAQLDLCSGDRLEYSTHLKAAQDIVKRRGSDGTERAYFQQRLAWMDTLSATTSSQLPLMKSEDVKSALNQFNTSQGRQWGFDVFDCPIGLFEVLVDIISLQKLCGSSNIPSDDALQRAIALGHVIRTWAGPDSTTDDRRDIVEIWRDGILLYLIRLFQISHETFGTPDLLENIFRRGTRLALATERKFATSWPLFQAGLCLDGNSLEHKQWLRGEFGLHFRTRGCYNAKLAVEVLNTIWETGDHRIVQLHGLLF